MNNNILIGNGSARHWINHLDGQIRSNHVNLDMNSLGILVAFAFITVIVNIPTYHGSMWQILSFAAVLGIITFLLFSQAKNADEWERSRRWKKQFVKANPDLDYSAIKRVIKHLRANTGYPDVSFKTVAADLLICLDEKAAHGHPPVECTQVNYLIFYAYLHFSTGEERLPQTFCVKK